MSPDTNSLPDDINGIIQPAILKQIAILRQHQDAKWGAHCTHPATTWLRILVEEVGEVAMALDTDTQRNGDLEAELLDVAGVAVSWLEDINRQRLMRFIK